MSLKRDLRKLVGSEIVYSDNNSISTSNGFNIQMHEYETYIEKYQMEKKDYSIIKFYTECDIDSEIDPFINKIALTGNTMSPELIYDNLIKAMDWHGNGYNNSGELLEPYIVDIINSINDPSAGNKLIINYGYLTIEFLRERNTHNAMIKWYYGEGVDDIVCYFLKFKVTLPNKVNEMKKELLLLSKEELVKQILLGNDIDKVTNTYEITTIERHDPDKELKYRNIIECDDKDKPSFDLFYEELIKILETNGRLRNPKEYLEFYKEELKSGYEDGDDIIQIRNNGDTDYAFYFFSHDNDITLEFWYADEDGEFFDSDAKRRAHYVMINKK